jgi:hypothetical protein
MPRLVRTVTRPSSSPSTIVASMKFDVPMKSATKRFSGRS